MRLFVIMSVTILILMFSFMFFRLIQPLQLGRKIGYTYIVLAVSIIMSIVSTRTISSNLLVTVLSWYGYTLMGLFSFLLVFLIIREFTLLIFTTVSYFYPLKWWKIHRIEFIKISSWLVIGISSFTSLIAVYQARKFPIVKEVDIKLPHLPSSFVPFKILQISDVHLGATIGTSFVKKLVNVLKNQSADMIAVTGDLVDGSVVDLGNDAMFLKELSAPLGIYFVTGNHEYYSGASEWVEYLKKIGINVLVNENKVYSNYNSVPIMIAGVTDYKAGSVIPEHQSDPVKALKGINANNLNILLAHQPKTFFNIENFPVNLQLSGHTHGGQFFPWNFFVQFDQPYIKGLYHIGKKWLYVNQGTGYWGIPMRLGTFPEITLLTITKD